jgi:hypothetical protein
MSVPAIVVQGKTVSIEKISKSFGIAFVARLSFCNNVFLWHIHFHSDKCQFDVTPVISSFDAVSYNPYEAINLAQLFDNIGGEQDIEFGLKNIVKVLVGAFLEDQSGKISIVPKSNRSEFIFGMLETIPDVSYLILKGGSQILVQFPLLHASRLTHTDMKYLIDATSCQPIEIVLDSSNVESEESFLTSPRLVFPPNLPCSRQILLPDWNRDTMLFDYISDVETKLWLSLKYRKCFTEELQKIAAVVTFDPLDYSFVSIALRLSKNKMAVVCTVDIRIPGNFPSSPLPLLVHDLQQNCDYNLDSKLCDDKSLQYPEKSAVETYIHINESIFKLAFTSSS